MSDQAADQQAAVQQQKVIGNQSTAPRTPADQERTRAAGDFSRVDNDNRPRMYIKVYSPFQNYYDSQAFSISAENTTGPFDVLPGHHNFISLLSACELVIRGIAEGDRRIRISGGIMHVKADRVIVFLDV